MSTPEDRSHAAQQPAPELAPEIAPESATMPSLSRRTLFKAGGAALAGIALASHPLFVHARPTQQGETVLSWGDPLPENPVPQILVNRLDWETADSWFTPNDEFFNVNHFGIPEIEAENYQLDVTGLVANPLSLSLADLQARTRHERIYTIECSGNHGFEWLRGAIGNASWAGASLASILKEAEVLDDGIEVIFYGADLGEFEVREQAITQPFARSMSIEDAMNPQNIICYEMNGEPLPPGNGFPVRLIAPGWYGVANVKWLTRIDIINTRYAGHWMAREYVTLRREETDNGDIWTETLVGRSLLKSEAARVVRNADGSHRIEGAAWGAPIRSVEVSIDGGSWQEADIDWSHYGRYAWKFWSLAWDDATPGEHTITTRATDTDGNVQPAADNPLIANKVTYWESNGQVTRPIEIPA